MTIRIRRDAEIYDTEGGWFRARWHFSFDTYRDPDNDSFGAMRVFNDDHLNQRDFYWDAPHPTLGSVRQIGSPLRMSSTPAVRRSAGPLLGADTEAVLRENGLDEDTIQRLLDAGVVAGLATDPLPTDTSVQTDPTAPVTATPPL